MKPKRKKAAPIRTNPTVIRGVVPYLETMPPINGEQMMTAIEYIEKISPTSSSWMPFSLNSRGKNGAIRAYAVFETKVTISTQTIFVSQN